MSRPVPDRARELATELERLFAGDAELAGGPNDAHRRLMSANDRWWSGLRPEGLASAYGDHPQFDTVRLEAAFGSRSEVLESADPLPRCLVRGAQHDARGRVRMFCSAGTKEKCRGGSSPRVLDSRRDTVSSAAIG